MPRWSKTTPTLGEREIFGDEDIAAMRADLEELATTVCDLAGQLHAQFTTIAAHAEIAREQSEFARDEARADLDRTRASLIELIEQARRTHRSYPPPKFDRSSASERPDALEQRVDRLTKQVGDLADRQRELTEMMAALLDSVVSGDRHEPVAGLTLA